MTRPIDASIGVTFPYLAHYKNGTLHKGVDFSDGHEGHEVLSCLDGTVSHAGYGGWGPAYGQHVIIKSTFKGKTKWVLYGHLQAEHVSVGQKVKAGQKIGTSGGAAGRTYSGNSTGPHLHVQVGHANVYTAYEDPWPIINYKAPKPAPTPPKVEPERWFGVDYRNLALFNDHGAATYNERVPKIIADVQHVGSEVVVVVELSDPKVAHFTHLMAAIGYKQAGGDLGRHIYVKEAVKVHDGKLVDLKPRLHNDTKQAYLAYLQLTHGAGFVVGVAQLENEDATGTTQVQQAHSYLTQLLAFASHNKVPISRVVPALDGNSDSRVYLEVFEPAGFLDTALTAYKSENGVWRSFVGWLTKPTKGKRIDLILAYKTRPVRRFRLRTQTAKLSDHLDLFADIGKIT